MPKRLIFTIVCFHIAAAISVFVSIAALVLGSNIHGFLNMLGAEAGDPKAQHLFNMTTGVLPALIISVGIFRFFLQDL